MDSSLVPYAFSIVREQLIHVIDGDLGTCQVLCAAFKIEGHRVTFSTSMVDALARIELTVPHAVILNDQLDGSSTLEAMRTLRRQHRGMPVVMIQNKVNLDSAVAAMKLGATDVLAKPIDAERLLGVVRAGLRAQTTVARDDKHVTVAGFRSLTNRERQVLELITNGRSNKEAGHLFGISPRTVEVHRAKIMTKLGAKNTADLMRIVLTS